MMVKTIESLHGWVQTKTVRIECLFCRAVAQPNLLVEVVHHGVYRRLEQCHHPTDKCITRQQVNHAKCHAEMYGSKTGGLDFRHPLTRFERWHGGPCLFMEVKRNGIDRRFNHRNQTADEDIAC